MKKLFAFVLALFLAVSVVFPYSEGKVLRDVGIPYKVSHIEFWNGGTKIAEMSNATVEILVQADESFFTLTKDGNKVQFYVYKVTAGGKTVKIIDSEALAILFTE